MKQYNKINNLVGWLTFAVAAFTYCMTIEPTASFWDCPEFITTGYKLEVGHPPGAPFFMLTANLFSQFASDATQVAKMVNIMSALMSAACILFLFWSITHLTKKLICPDDKEMTTGKLITIMGAGLIGALAYTWSDTFWFSAVEGEVYAYSSLFTAVVFWLILKWENRANEPHSDRWLILIAYLTGLSIGVHLLNLLCIPAIVLVYYYKKNPNANLKGSLIALAGSMILVAVVLYGIVPGIVKVGGWFELLFVNDFGLPFNTGVIIYMIILAASIIWGVYESYTVKSRKRMNISFLTTVGLLGIPFYGHGWSSVFIGIIVLAILAIYLFANIGEKYRVSARTLNTSLLAMMMIVVGYSSYAVIVIRSSANTPMDQNSPEDIFTLGEYLGREQYGTRPLFYGQTYASKPALKPTEGGCVYDVEEGAPVYQRKEKERPDEKDSYEIVRHKTEYKYAQNMLFPRMYSDAHAQAYEDWLGGVEGRQVPYDQCGEMIMVKIPTQWDNIKFFFIYQLNYMYWRYFMWNFAGRQNDIQGQGEIEHGNWITGISFIDNMLIGDQTLLPSELKNNKGHNVFYCLPLILGLIGLFWQAYKGEKGIQQFWIVFFLFFMTGLAIVLYLNQTPQQPRERDYAYAGSFYAFAIWIGLGVAAIAEYLSKKINEKPAAILASVVCLLVPVQMVSQTWDDHDRSGRMVCHDMGQNYLYTLQEKGNPVLFVNGDNETFPLWYSTEVENIRTDTRVCNLMYLSGGWYADQMKRPAYSSPGLPFSIPRAYYRDGVNDAVSVNPVVGQDENGTAIRLKEQIETFYREHPDEKPFGEDPWEWKNIVRHWLTSDKADLRCIPTDEIHIPVDKEAVRRSGMLIPEGTEIPDTMIIRLKGRGYLTRSSLMLIDLISSCNWERPLYVASTMRIEEYLDISRNLVQEGLAQRIVPYDAVAAGATIDTDKTYRNLMEKFRYGGLDNPELYLDETNIRMVLSLRRIMTETAERLYQQGDTLRARRLLDRCCQEIRNPAVQTDKYGYSDRIGILYQLLGETSLGIRHWMDWYTDRTQYADWYLTLSPERLLACDEELVRILYAQSDGLQNALRCGMPVEEKTITRYLHTAQTARLRLQQCGSRYTRLIDELTAPFNGTEGDTIH